MATTASTSAASSRVEVEPGRGRGSSRPPPAGTAIAGRRGLPTRCRPGFPVPPEMGTSRTTAAAEGHGQEQSDGDEPAGPAHPRADHQGQADDQHATGPGRSPARRRPARGSRPGWPDTLNVTATSTERGLGGLGRPACEGVGTVAVGDTPGRLAACGGACGQGHRCGRQRWTRSGPAGGARRRGRSGRSPPPPSRWVTRRRWGRHGGGWGRRRW